MYKYLTYILIIGLALFLTYKYFLNSLTVNFENVGVENGKIRLTLSVFNPLFFNVYISRINVEVYNSRSQKISNFDLESPIVFFKKSNNTVNLYTSVQEALFSALTIYGGFLMVNFSTKLGNFSIKTEL